MKTINGALKDLAIKLNEKLGGEPLTDTQVKSVTGYLQQIAGILSDDASNAETLTGVTAIESIADAVENIDIGGGDVVKGLIERSISQQISIPDGTTEIGVYAFNGCISLPGEVVLPESVELIGQYAFSNCEQLTKIEALNADVKTELQGAYAGCVNVTEVPPVTSPYEDTESSTRNAANSTFAGCGKLKRAVITNPTTIDSAFAGCASLEYAYIGSTCRTIKAGSFGGVPVTCVIECGFAEGAIEGFPANGGFAGNPSDVQITYNVPAPSAD